MTRVWIDQDICTGDGICSEICPELFGPHETGLWHVKEESWSDIYNGGDPKDGPVYEMATGTANVPDHLLETCVGAAEECPGECIFIELD